MAYRPAVRLRLGYRTARLISQGHPAQPAGSGLPNRPLATAGSFGATLPRSHFATDEGHVRHLWAQHVNRSETDREQANANPLSETVPSPQICWPSSLVSYPTKRLRYGCLLLGPPTASACAIDRPPDGYWFRDPIKSRPFLGNHPNSLTDPTPDRALTKHSITE